MRLTVELETEKDGRWVAEVLELPGVLAYGTTREDALASALALVSRVLTDKLEHVEAPVATKPRQPGGWEGQVRISEDFNDSLPPENQALVAQAQAEELTSTQSGPREGEDENPTRRRP